MPFQERLDDFESFESNQQQRQRHEGRTPEVEKSTVVLDEDVAGQKPQQLVEDERQEFDERLVREIGAAETTQRLLHLGSVDG